MERWFACWAAGCVLRCPCVSSIARLRGSDLDRARQLLDRIDLLEHPCDLDLLIFFARHPVTLLASEQLAVLLGYEFTQIATSLDRMQRGGLLIASENPTYIARKYVFAAGDQNAEWLPDLLQLGSTREGRLNLMRALSELTAGRTGGPGTRATRDAAPRPASNSRRGEKRDA